MTTETNTADDSDQDFSAAFAAASSSIQGIEQDALAPAPEVEAPAAPVEPAAPAADDPEPPAPMQEPHEGSRPPDTDMWASLTDPQKAELEKLRKSNAGLQDQLRRRLIENERLKSVAPPADARPAPHPVIERFKEDYPDVANPVQEMIAAAHAETAALRASVAELNQQAQTLAIVQQQDMLAAQHPDWLSIARSSDFQAWILEQPRGVQDIAIRNQSAILDAGDAAVLFTLYKKTVTPAANNSQNQPHQQQPATKRQHQLQSSVTAPHRGPAPAPDTADSFDATFKMRAAEYRKQQT